MIVVTKCQSDIYLDWDVVYYLFWLLLLYAKVMLVEIQRGMSWLEKEWVYCM